MKQKLAQHVVGLDLDGVIVDHTENRLRLAGDFGFSLAAKDTAADVISTKLPVEVHNAIQRYIYDDPAVALSASLIPGACEGLAWLAERNIPYRLISRRRNSTIAVELLKRHGLWPRYLHEENAEFVVTPEDKNDSAKKTAVTIYLDDEPDVLGALTSVPHRFLFDPLNVHRDTDWYVRLASWDKFREMIASFTEKTS